MNTLLRAASFIDVGDSLRLTVFAHQHFPGHGARNEFQASSLLRGRDENLARTEVGSQPAAASALSAVMTGWAAVERLGENRHSRGNAGNPNFVAGALENHFAATRLGRRLENTVGRAGNVFLRTEHADVGFGLVVVRSNVVVGNGPILAQAVASLRSKIHGREAQCDAAPVVRASAHNAGAEPTEL